MSDDESYVTPADIAAMDQLVSRYGEYLTACVGSFQKFSQTPGFTDYDMIVGLALALDELEQKDLVSVLTVAIRRLALTPENLPDLS